MGKTCSECSCGELIRSSLNHYCKKTGLVIKTPIETAKECDSFRQKEEENDSYCFSPWGAFA